MSDVAPTSSATRDVPRGPAGNASALDPSIASRLEAVGSRLRRLILLEGLAWVLGGLFGGALIQFILDYGTRGLQWSMRATALGAIVAFVAWLVWRRIVRPLRVGCSPVQIAKLLERRYPELSSALVSGVQFSRGEIGPTASNSPDLVDSVIRQAGEAAGSLDFHTVLDPKRARFSSVLMVGLLVSGGAVTWASPELVGLWLARNVLLQEVEWPKRTHLFVEVEGDELTGARGDDLVIQGYATGVQPREVEIVYETVSGKQGRDLMVTVGSVDTYHYRYTFHNASEDFEFYLEGGDDRTDPVRVRLLERPKVTRTEMVIQLPAYTRLEPLTLGDGQRATQLLPGSEVTFSIETNKPVVSASLMAGRDVVSNATRDEDRFRVAITPEKSHTYHFALLDEFGLDNVRPMRFSVRLTPDQPPRVRMTVPGVGDMITVDAVLPIELEFSDEHGLATAELSYQLAGEDMLEGAIPIPGFTPRLPTFKTSVDWSATSSDLIISPGDTLTLRAGASDFDNVRGPNVTQSPETTLRVVTVEELLAELARREREYRAEFERLVDAQEEVRSGLLSVIGASQQTGSNKSKAEELAALERRQRSIGGSINVIRQRFEQVLSELRINGLDTLNERKRLGGGIIEPMTKLVRRDLPLSADTLRRWSNEDSAEQAVLVDPQQVALLTQMREILANMIQWEGYQEVVNMLRDILRLQEELRAEIQDTLQEQADDVFDD